jgi:hypothetical protein
MPFVWCGAATQRGSWPPHSRGFLDHTQLLTTVGRTPLDEWSARRRDLYLTTHNTHNRQTSMPPVGFEPTISTGERSQTHALDHAATGTGAPIIYILKSTKFTLKHLKTLKICPCMFRSIFRPSSGGSWTVPWRLSKKWTETCRDKFKCFQVFLFKFSAF